MDGCVNEVQSLGSVFGSSPSITAAHHGEHTLVAGRMRGGHWRVGSLVFVGRRDRNSGMRGEGRRRLGGKGST
jgi:hypothetical protein